MASQLECAFCFEVLASHLEDREALPFEEFLSYWKLFGDQKKTGYDQNDGDESGNSAQDLATSDGQLNKDAEYPLFVTWKAKTAMGSRELRGCKGTFRGLPLAQGLSEFALISALEDYRFSPIELDELPTLHCDVTLLHSFEPCHDSLDWEIGVHGIRISFEEKGKKYGATFLPDVMVEQGWGKKEAIISAVRKSGSKALSHSARGEMGKWAVVEALDVKVTRYQGWKSGMQYSEWNKWRSWVNEEIGETSDADRSDAS